MSGEKILTVPEEITDYEPYYLTGNHYVGLPLISPVNGGIQSVNLISMTTASLIEFYGAENMDLLSPYVTVCGEKLPMEGCQEWKYRDYWIPEFSARQKIKKDSDGVLEIKGRIYAPLDLRGFIYSLEFINHLEEEVQLEAGMEGAWQTTRKTIFSQRPMPGTNYIFYDRWTDTIVMECLSWTNLGALAIGWGQPLTGIMISGNESRPALEKGFGAENNEKELLSFQLRNSLHLSPGGRAELNYYIAANMERDGARTSVVDMKRYGAKAKYGELRDWLEEHRIDVGDYDLNRVLNKNLFFNYFFAVARAIDTEEIVMITSRSPRYYVSAAYWPRDTFLWSYPALLMVDHQLAREVLMMGFARHMKNGGIHSQYISGTVLYPGFELDQLCAYIVALKGYLAKTGDETVLNEEAVNRGIKIFYSELQQVKGNKGLYRTFLDPSDDPVTYPYLIYNNALVWVALNYLADINKRLQLIETDLESQAGEVAEAIARLGIVEYREHRIYAWAVDGEGNFEVYDNPPGSLMVLEHYGFPIDPEVFRNTLDWIMSQQNPYYTDKGNFTGFGSVHARRPWILGAANSILAGHLEESRDFFKRVYMDNGFACETIDEITGMARTGNAFATCAGFLAYAIFQGFGNRGGNNYNVNSNGNPG